MKNMENMKALDEIELVKVAGGDLPTIFNPGPDVTKGQKLKRLYPIINIFHSDITVTKRLIR